ncbi:MAG: glycosyltransferase family 2 protein [Burkholderiaceae bacterium]|nr:glycosyltransferase family 2 protein [Burkholderiaceae bacterium]
MTINSKGAHAPFFAPELLNLSVPRTRFETLLTRALSSLTKGNWADALLAVETVCRSMPSEHLASSLRAKIIERALPSLTSKAWFKAWLVAPENTALQDSMLRAWLQSGAVDPLHSLGLAALSQRCEAHTESSLVQILVQAKLLQFAACWKEQTAVVGVVFNFAESASEKALANLCVSNETEDFFYQVPANGTRFQFTPPNQHDLWSISFCCNEPDLVSTTNPSQRKWLLASGSPLAFACETINVNTRFAHAQAQKLSLHKKSARQSSQGNAQANKHTPSTVSIIIPVYRDLASVKACITSVLESQTLNQTKAKIIIIDDNSPEPAVSTWLQTLSSETNITVLKNRQNLGFIGSTNRGLRHHAEADALMLNADTVVHGNWLDRLVAALYSDDNIASVVPWSNNAEITSLPKIAVASLPPTTQELAQIDTLAAQLHQQGDIADVELPSCIGFAMLMRRKVIDEIGVLDAVHLVRGYGEEVDWCLRARAAGYKHMAATGVFLSHTGTISFRFEKTLRVKQNKRVLQQRYPHYELEYALFRRDDPLSKARSVLLNALTKKQNTWLKNAQLRLEPDDALMQNNGANAVPLFSMALPAPLPSSCVRIAIWNLSIANPYAKKILELARLVASQKDLSVRLLVIGEANEALWHTGVVDVLPRLNSIDAPLISDMEFLGLSNCVACWVLANGKHSPAKIYMDNFMSNLKLPATIVNDQLDIVAWFETFREAHLTP